MRGRASQLRGRDVRDDAARDRPREAFVTPGTAPGL